MESFDRFFEKGILNQSDRIPYGTLLNTLINGISDYIFLMEVKGENRFTYILVNHAANRHHPLEEATWEGLSIEDVLSKDKAEPIIEKYQQVVDLKKTINYEDEVVVNGTIFRGHTSLTPLKNADGEVTHILAITRDITAIVEKERDLTKINAIYRSLLENTADAILIMDLNRRVIEANQAFEQLYGYSREELVHTSFPFVPDGMEEEVEELIRCALAKEKVSGFQTVRRKKNGTLVEVSMTVSPIENELGQTIGISSIVRDISAIKENERQLTASRSRYHSLFKHNPHPILTLDDKGAIIQANTSSLALLKKKHYELRRTTLMDWLPDEYAEWMETLFQGPVLEKDTWFQARLTIEDKERIVNIYLVPIINQMKQEGLYAILDDITEKEQAAEALRQSEAKFRLIADHSNDLISVFSFDGELIYASPSVTEFFGYNIMNLRDGASADLLNPDDLVFVRQAFIDCHRNKEAFKVEVKLRGKTKTEVWFECRGTPVLDDAGHVHRIVVVARDISEQKTYEARLERIAFYDYLTGLPNRRLFEDRLEQTIIQSRRSEIKFALLYLDGDSFKQINDDYGHDTGDDFLKRVGDRMRGCIREGDSIGRIGGDEFAILLNDITSGEQAKDIAMDILKQLRFPYPMNGFEIHSSFSIGVACYPEDGKTLDDLFRAADQALYSVKSKGKNQVCLYDRHCEMKIADEV